MSLKIRASEKLLHELQRLEAGSYEDCLRGEEGTPHTEDPSQHPYAILNRRKASIVVETRVEAVNLLDSIDNSFDIMANHAIHNSPEDERRIRPMLKSIRRIMTQLQQYLART